MAARIQQTKPNPDITTGVQHLFKAIYAGGVPQQTLELVHLRALPSRGHVPGADDSTPLLPVSRAIRVSSLTALGPAGTPRRAALSRHQWPRDTTA